MIIDRLYKDVQDKGMVCLGLDPNIDYIPREIKDKYQDIDEVIFQFNKKIIDCTFDIVSIYKPQIAFYEAFGIKGLQAYSKTLKYIQTLGTLTLGDIKRGDISTTASMYGKAHFTGDFEADFITLNPFMGYDTIEPYLPYLRDGNKGIFVLLRTSNKGAKDIQYKESDGERIYYHIGDSLNQMAQEFIGTSGYSSLGLVVGGTHTDEAIDIRKRYPHLFFLIPGYNAQGASGEDVKLYLNDLNGGVVNSSRGIICAYMKEKDGYNNFEYFTRKAVLDMREDIGFK